MACSLAHPWPCLPKTTPCAKMEAASLDAHGSPSGGKRKADADAEDGAQSKRLNAAQGDVALDDEDPTGGPQADTGADDVAADVGADDAELLLALAVAGDESPDVEAGGAVEEEQPVTDADGTRDVGGESHAVAAEPQALDVAEPSLEADGVVANAAASPSVVPRLVEDAYMLGEGLLSDGDGEGSLLPEPAPAPETSEPAARSPEAPEAEIPSVEAPPSDAPEAVAAEPSKEASEVGADAPPAQVAAADAVPAEAAPAEAAPAEVPHAEVQAEEAQPAKAGAEMQVPSGSSETNPPAAGAAEADPPAEEAAEAQAVGEGIPASVSEGGDAPGPADARAEGDGPGGVPAIQGAGAPPVDAVPEREPAAQAADAGASAATAGAAAAPGEAASDAKDATATPAQAVSATGVDDVVPIVTYDENDKKCLFSKDGRWVIPKREQFPSVFCALRVQVRLETAEAEPGADPPKPVAQLPPEAITRLLKTELGFEKNFVRFDEVREPASTAGSRDVVVALSGEMAACPIGSRVLCKSLAVTATVLDIVETSDDMAPSRITSIASRFKEAAHCDAIVFELPQLWIIPDTDFVAKSASIGLYPGSYWMAFFKSWGPIRVADVFFRTVTGPRSEATVHLVVQYRSRESLKMCFTFLYDRYLVHPKMKHQLRPPWCRLASFEEFKTGAVGGPSAAKAKAKTGPKAVAPPGAAAAAKAVAKVATAPALSVAGPPKSRPVAKAPIVKRVPAPKLKGVDKAAPIVEAKSGKPVSASAADDAALPLSASEVMKGLQGKQLVAFQMMMSRVERLEKENQELMQILLQMQGLLQQQQQRNARLAQRAALNAGARQAAGSAASRAARADVAQGDTAGGEEIEDAPWKTQRRRQKRPRVEAPDGGASGVGFDASNQSSVRAGGFDVYNTSLLGI